MGFTVRLQIRSHRYTCLATHAQIRRICVTVLISLAALLCGSYQSPLLAQTICATPYIVQAGDSWTKIAKQCGVSYPDLQAANPQLWSQRGANIRPGDTMVLPLVDGSPQMSSTAAPMAAIQAFYAALAQGLSQHRDLSAAYAYLSSNRQATQSLAGFRNAYPTTTEVKILHIKLIEQQPTTAKVGVIVVTVDLEQGQPKPTQYDAIYQLVLEAGAWRIGKTVQYDEIGLLSQGALAHWYSNNISQNLPATGEIEIWHSNTLPAEQGSINYQFTLHALSLLNNVEIAIALIGGDGQSLAEQVLTIEHLGGATVDWYQIGMINVSNQLQVDHFQIRRATAEVDGKEVAVLAQLQPVLFQPLPIVTDSGIQ